VPAADALAVLDAIPQETVPAAILRLTARLVAAPRPEPPDDLLTVEQAVTLLRQSRRWVWTHARELGGVRPSPRKLLLSRRRVLRWVETRRTD
jgi:hypothetical protein